MFRRMLGGILGLLLVYVLLDIGYRAYQFHKLESAEVRLPHVFSTFESPLDVLDTKTGFAYKAGTRVHQRLYDQDGVPAPHVSTIVTNNVGLISPDNSVLAKPETEYRIAVIGDSFSATTTSSLTWPTALQQLLNQDPSLAPLVAKKSFKVLNFGLDGTGFVQWPDVYRYKAEQFRPDMLIVNFMWSDPIRRYIYRDTVKVGGDDYAMIVCASLPATLGNPTCQSALSFILDPEKPDFQARALRISKEIHEREVRRLPWFSPYPELLAVLLKGRFGLEPRLVVRSYYAALYDSQEEAFRVSRESLRQLAARNSKLIVLFHPTVEQCLSKKAPEIISDFMRQAADFKIVNMLEALPLNTSEREIRNWYNVPYDSHPSDYGAQVYALAVREQLRANWKENYKPSCGSKTSGHNDRSIIFQQRKRG
jgi:hypothetical protein